VTGRQIFATFAASREAVPDRKDRTRRREDAKTRKGRGTESFCRFCPLVSLRRHDVLLRHMGFQDFVEMMRDPKVMELIEKFFPPEFLILLREPIGSPKFCEALGKLGFNALMDALIGLASGGALAGIKKMMEHGGEALKNAIEAAGKHVRKCTNCFVAGTLVVTACGWVPIEEVQVGDWVWARDEVTGEVRLCEVEETYRNESPVILEVTAGGETLATTPGHPFWVQDHGWKDAGELEVGDRLMNLRGESVVVEDIRRRPVPEAVYNFSVAGLHTYFVGQGGIWVHNNSGSGCGVPGGLGNNAGRYVNHTDGQFLGEIAARAESKIGGTGAVAGTHKHTYAEELLDRYQSMTGQRQNLVTERSFLNGQQVPRGSAGSARPDVYDPASGAVYDYKFTINPGRGIPAVQQSNNARNLPHVTSQTEINP
jgi:hypothetical protein